MVWHAFGGCIEGVFFVVPGAAFGLCLGPADANVSTLLIQVTEPRRALPEGLVVSSRRASGPLSRPSRRRQHLCGGGRVARNPAARRLRGRWK